MKIEKEKVLGSSAAGQGSSRHYWPGRDEDDSVDYEALFRSFMEKLFANRGAFKVDGSLLFEFLPKATVKNEKLISSETSFYFHQFEESNGYGANIAHANTDTENEEVGLEVENAMGSAMDSYLYHRKVVPPSNTMEDFIPII